MSESTDRPTTQPNPAPPAGPFSVFTRVTHAVCAADYASPTARRLRARSAATTRTGR